MGIRPGLLAAMLKAGHLQGAIRWKVDIDSDLAQQEISMAGAYQVVLDTHGVKDLSDFFAVFHKQVAPSGVDHVDMSNFEAVVSSLPTRTAMLWIGWQDFVKHSAADAAVVADVLDVASSQWPGVVLVLGKSGTYPNIGELTSVS